MIRRALLTLAFCALSAAALSQPVNNSGQYGSGHLPKPYWLLGGNTNPATVDLDFYDGRYYQNGLVQYGVYPSFSPTLISTTRASIGYAVDASGNWHQFGTIARVALWPSTALSAGQLQQITSGTSP